MAATASVPTLDTVLPAGSKQSQPVRRPVRTWLIVGLVMVFFQVFIGGVTRLTDSGLSITEWAVIQGTLPPLNAADWDQAFLDYQAAASKQFETLHADMTLSEFKFIYFWEYFHRLWARLIGVVFAIPFFIFLRKGWLPKWLVRSLLVVVVLAAIEATMGWIMVASGLNEGNRTWVSAYKLVAHLSIATILFGFLFWTYLRSRQPKPALQASYAGLRRTTWIIASVLFLQIIFGGLMAGMRAGLLHPHWPMFVEGQRLFGALAQTTGDDLVNYENSAYIKAVVQIVHRITAYGLSALILVYFFTLRRRTSSPLLRRGNNFLLAMLGVQFTLGVLTIVNSIGSIPLWYGVFHQGGALILLLGVLYLAFYLRQPSLSTSR